MLLYVIRHGDPDYVNDTLTEKGRQQASALARRLKMSGIQHVYTSPLGRAVETAIPTCQLLGLSYTIEEWCSESLAWQDFTIRMPDGRKKWIFQQQNTNLKNDATIRKFDDWHDIECIRGINGKAGMARIARNSDAFLERLGYKREGSIYRIVRPNPDKVAVFCHQGFSLAWFSHLLQIPPHIFWASFDICHTGVVILEFADNDNDLTAPKCLCFSDISHLISAGLSTTYNNEIDI